MTVEVLTRGDLHLRIPTYDIACGKCRSVLRASPTETDGEYFEGAWRPFCVCPVCGDKSHYGVYERYATAWTLAAKEHWPLRDGAV